MQASEAFVQQQASASPDHTSKQKIVFKDYVLSSVKRSPEKWAVRLLAKR